MFLSSNVSSSPPAGCLSRTVLSGTNPDILESVGRVDDPGTYAGLEVDGAKATCLRGLLWIEHE